MLNNFIDGGQVFLHKVRMFRQVLAITIFVSLIGGFGLAWHFTSLPIKKLDIDEVITYAKAHFVEITHPAISTISIKSSPAVVDAYSGDKLWQKNMPTKSVLSSNRFRSAWELCDQIFWELLVKSLMFGGFIAVSIFVVWNSVGRALKSEYKKKGSSMVLTARAVSIKLRLLNKVGDFRIGRMPLVKDSETRHFLVTGATGSGKTNLIHCMLEQVKEKSQAAIIVDQTGEMIARYYDPQRGDIILNPFDARSHEWDFFADCASLEELERFAKILFSFNRKRSRSYSDPFWEQSAEAVFIACVEYLVNNDKANLRALTELTTKASLKTLQNTLEGTGAQRYLTDDGKGMASSVISMLATNSKPMSYLSDQLNAGMDKFSIKNHLQEIKTGSSSWLFLSTKPSSRELTLPLISCLSELSLSYLMDIGIDKSRKVWCVFDELASLGSLPALPTLMSEGRKYGACVMAGLQSLNQLYDNYGHYAGSSIFGQFGTSFFFRNTEPDIAKLFSDMCGTETVMRQQKNTSFGANTFRDGVSYGENQQKQSLVELNHLAGLQVGECYALLPEPTARIAKIQTFKNDAKDKNQGFVARQ